MAKQGRGNSKGRKRTKAAASASNALRGQQTTPRQKVHITDHAEVRATGSWLNRPMLGTRLTWRAVVLFMLACIMLDAILWAVFELGLGKCYGVLCLL